jgi:hypothetical protein
MSAPLTLEGTTPRPGMTAPSRATLRTRPPIQRILIRSWEYIPAIRVAVLAVRLLAVVVVVAVGIALLSISNWWGLVDLAAAPAVAAVGLWVFTTAAKGWPVR